MFGEFFHCFSYTRLSEKSRLNGVQARKFPFVFLAKGDEIQHHLRTSNFKLENFQIQRLLQSLKMSKSNNLINEITSRTWICFLSITIHRNLLGSEGGDVYARCCGLNQNFNKHHLHSESSTTSCEWKSHKMFITQLSFNKTRQIEDKWVNGVGTGDCNRSVMSINSFIAENLLSKHKSAGKRLASKASYMATSAPTRFLLISILAVKFFPTFSLRPSFISFTLTERIFAKKFFFGHRSQNFCQVSARDLIHWLCNKSL